MRSILKVFCSIVIFLIAGVYIVNYEASGDLEFVKTSTKLYSAPDKKEVELTLQPGEKLYSLTYYADDGMDKVRYTDPDTGKKMIGFVNESSISSYTFPSQSIDSLGEPIILSVSKDTSLEDFIKTLISLPDDFSIIGVYVESDSDKQSDIVTFCEEQHIPYGYVSNLDDLTYEIYISNERYSSTDYNILPQVFRVTDVNYTGDKYDFTKCILYTSNSSAPNNADFKYWITVDMSSRDASLFADNPSIVACKYKSDSTSFGYSYISDEFEAQIERAYD